MNPLEFFVQYAAAFEESYADDDWSRLDAYFAEDAVYVVTGEPPLGGRWEGRQGVIEHLHEVVDQLDRRFDSRKVDLVGAPTLDGDEVALDWKATYEKAGCPDLVFGGRERTVVEGGRIVLLEDAMDEGSDREIQDYMQRYLD